MEQYIKIPTSDGFEINGVLNWKEKSDTLIIFVHGLTGYGGEAHYVGGKNFFTQKGYTVCRFDFYGGGEKNRTLQDSSISSHARDLEDILKYFEREYKNIFFVAHSLGGPSIIRMQNILENLKKIVFWDPAFDTQGVEKRFIQEGGKTIFTSGDGRYMEVSPLMLQERQQNHFTYLESFSFDAKKMFIIFAGGNTKTVFKPETDKLGIQSYVIEGANHGFTQEGKYEELFDKTLEFIEK